MAEGKKKLWKIRRSKLHGFPVEVMTFIGTTEAEYDEFLDARFADGTDPIGFNRSANAPHSRLISDNGKEGFAIHPLQFRRYIPDPNSRPGPKWN